VSGLDEKELRKCVLTTLEYYRDRPEELEGDWMFRPR